MCSDLDSYLVPVANAYWNTANELCYNAFTNNAANIRNVKSCYLSTNALLKRETFSGQKFGF